MATDQLQCPVMITAAGARYPDPGRKQPARRALTAYWPLKSR
jgi:hypothetical protein